MEKPTDLTMQYLREQAQAKANRERRRQYILKEPIRGEFIVTRFVGAGDQVIEHIDHQWNDDDASQGNVYGQTSERPKED
jgi:hypothetical protein